MELACRRLLRLTRGDRGSAHSNVGLIKRYFGPECAMRMWSSEGHPRLDDEKPASPGRGQHQQTGGGRLDPRNLWLILRWRVRLVAATTLATVALTVCALVIL